MGKRQSITIPSDSLFTSEDYNTLRRERRRLADMVDTLEKAKACGIECDFLESQRKQIDDQLASIEQHFMTPSQINPANT
jgi:hypothetical protein